MGSRLSSPSQHTSNANINPDGVAGITGHHHPHSHHHGTNVHHHGSYSSHHQTTPGGQQQHFIRTPSSHSSASAAFLTAASTQSSHGSATNTPTTCFVRDGVVTATDFVAAHNLSTSTSRSLSNSLSNSASTDYHLSHGLKCPVCFKFVVPDDLEYHLLMCLSKPNRLSYNEDVLTINKGECVICLEDLLQGEVIARLPCLCIYHKCCIDSWFQVNRSCPEHPSD